MRQTKQNTLILEIINTSRRHPTALEIYEMCREKILDISLGTVYRNLNKLVELGSIKRIKMPNNIDRFDKIHDNHNHFICYKCHRIIDLEDNYMNNLKNLDGNKILDCEISFKGICKECLLKEE